MGKSSSADRSAGRVAQAQLGMAQEVFNEGRPLRAGLTDQLSQVIQTGEADNTAQFRAGKSTLEDQVQRAREQIIAGTPEGGGLTSALTDLEMGRARGLAEMEGQIVDREIDRALQLGTFGAATGVQGVGTAGMVQAQRAASEAQQNAAKGRGMGQVAGAFIGK